MNNTISRHRLSDAYQASEIQPSSEMRASKAGRNTSITIPAFMRSMGILTVIVGMCAYLLEGWESWNGVSRFYVMLTGTGLLATAGFLLSYLMRENKGARAFLGLTLLSSLANITTLAGFIFSAVSAGQASHPVEYSQLLGMDWTLSSATSLLLMSAAAAMLLIPTCWFGFKVFNRHHATGLLGVFLAGSSLLLIPVRESLAIGMLLSLAVTLPFYYLHKTARGNTFFKTNEGRFSAAVLFAPSIIMLGRMLWLYEADAVVTWLICATLFSGSRYVALTVSNSSRLFGINDLIAILLSAMLSLLSLELVTWNMNDALYLPLAGGLFAALMHVSGNLRSVASPVLVTSGYAILAVTMVFNVVLIGSGTSQFLCVVASIAIWFVARMQGSRALRVCALITLLAGLLPGTFDLFESVDFTNWVTLAIVGALAILSASVAERYDVRKWFRSLI